MCAAHDWKKVGIRAAAEFTRSVADTLSSVMASCYNGSKIPDLSLLDDG